MSHPITQGRRIRNVNGVGYNLTWLGEREGRLCRLIFDLHSFDLRTLEDIEQLIPLRKIHSHATSAVEKRLKRSSASSAMNTRSTSTSSVLKGDPHA